MMVYRLARYPYGVPRQWWTPQNTLRWGFAVRFSSVCLYVSQRESDVLPRLNLGAS